MGVPDPAHARGVSPTPGAPREPPLGPRAARAASAVRDRPEEPDSLRTAFQRDRDRILHTTAFRRLKHKTQVFVAPVGDHYRTRLTHTLEVSAVARTTARALALNEDLVEAIAMGHDLGHAPFGHAGEAALDEILHERHGRRFEHNVQSLRVVEVLERGGGGLNLTDAVRDGILHHTGPGRPATLEGQTVRLMDRIAYVNHDIEDALRAGVLTAGDLPAGDVAILGATTSERLTTLVTDTVAASADADEIRQSPEIGTAFLRLRKFMFQNVYLAPPASGEADRARGVVQALFSWYLEHPQALPPAPEADPVTRVTDFVAGMTDRYALRLYREIFMPSEGPL
jgi:dGTPase